MSRLLSNHLYPQGASATEPDVIPSVLDNSGDPVSLSDASRKTTEVTVVDLGDSPNSNTGDPLRTAFIKLNNFVEASYWANESIDADMTAITNKINEIIAVVNAQHGTTITDL